MLAHRCKQSWYYRSAEQLMQIVYLSTKGGHVFVLAA